MTEWESLESHWATDATSYKRTDLLQLIQQADHTVAAVLQQYSLSPRKTGDLEVRDSATLYDSLCTIQAPMVRCSRPAFRQVCRLWGTKVNYTHMIMSECFADSAHARHADFAMYNGEERLIVQLAAKSGPAAGKAAALLAPYCDAIDINCGCPQKWAMREGIGAALLEKPESVADMVRCIRNALPANNAVPCVVKMRVKDDLRQSIEFARQCEAAGAAWLTIHGRSPACHPSAAVRWDSIRQLRASLSVPVVLNGAVASVSTAVEAALNTGCGGLMAGNGLLDNPAMFFAAKSREELERECSFAASSISIEGGSTPQRKALSPYSSLAAWRQPTREGLLTSVRTEGAVMMTSTNLWETRATPREVISDFIRAAIQTDLTVPTTVQQVMRMARMYISPAERNYMALLRSNIAVLESLEELGVYTDRGRIACS